MVNKNHFLKKRVQSLFVLKGEYFFENKKRLGKSPHRWGGFFSLKKARGKCAKGGKRWKKKEKGSGSS